MTYKKTNTYIGWLVFLIATIVYFLTIEDTVSLWDCGEYITAAYKLEVGHPPGAPLFMVLGRLFSFFAAPENVAIWINRLSALSSSGTILFMFWTLTMLIKKITLKERSVLTLGDKIAIFGSAAIGALAYTFSESFWFSAVEGEVYAMSSLFTAAIFWAIMKWDEEMMEIKHGLNPIGYSPDRWLLLIMFLLGLAIGVHLLGILVVPAIAYVIYFRYEKTVNWKGFFGVGILGVIILGFIQVGVISGSISIASMFEVGFVKTLGLPFYSGTIFFFIALIVGGVLAIKYARKKGYNILYSATLGLILLLIGYGSFAVIVIRSNANTPLDENDPENLVTLQAYLKREQYGTAPITYGGYWNSKESGGEFEEGRWVSNKNTENWKDISPFYVRRFIVEKNGNVLKAFEDESRANTYAKNIPGSEVNEDYYESNKSTRTKSIATYSQNTIFPRMYMNNDPRRIQGYKAWSGYDANDGTPTEKGKDGKRLPSFGENMQFFTTYQVNWMYWRYFMWNFSGRQNDIQNTTGNQMQGNWITGFSAVDNARLGDQAKSATYFTSSNPSNNKFFLLPLILGLIGLIFHFYKAPKDAFIISLLFLFTGVAIIVYLNPKPFEPRERDYAYAGSFYFFAMWIGVGAYALYEAFKSFGKKELMQIVIIGGAGLLVALFADMGSDVSMPISIMWLIILAIGGAGILFMIAIKKVLKTEVQGAIVAVCLSLFVPVIMGMQGWNDHDRSLKSSAHDLASNYLESNGDNGILFTNGDNDTFPLWYMQEVEGYRTDVRVCNLSLMQTDWYTNQMKLRTYESAPLPIKFTEDQILMYAGKTDQVLFADLFEMFRRDFNPTVIKKAIDLRAKAKPEEMRAAVSKLSAQGASLLNGASTSNMKALPRLNKIRAILAAPLSESNIGAQVYNKYNAAMNVFGSVQQGMFTMDESSMRSLQTLLFDFEKSWNHTTLAEAMEFVRDDANMVDFGGGQMMRIFPSNGFILPVNPVNAVKSQVITKKQANECHSELRFEFEERGLTREQVMMLDILANNDWERSVGFSSPGGSDVSMALYRKGYIKQNGMVFELSPLKNTRERFNADKMYNNLMENYSFGAMNNPNVLTDYYARRHTAQYRLHFYSLAEDYMRKALQAEEENKRIEMFAENPLAADIPEKTSEKVIAGYMTRARKLIQRSLEVMPAKIVLDYGEPSGSRQETYSVDGKSLSGYEDGILHKYVGLLYISGDKDGAEKLGLELASQLEASFQYFETSDVAISTKSGNTQYLYSALSAYYEILSSSNEEEFGNPKGELAMRTRERMSYVYSSLFPSMIDRLTKLVNDKGESTRPGPSAGNLSRQLFELKDYMNATAQSFGFVDGNGKGPAQGGPTLEDLMKMEAIKDSIEQ